ncbi:MAG: anhydro-N-acetylmuramic acid kinase [Bacteroidales bacterium]|nr:anhydro-N-acetylmuramic acid kinase [Bacteroidales bacterium]
MNDTATYIVAGIMSGSSLDGLDIAVVKFRKAEEGWQFQIIAAETIAYSPDMEEQLRQALSLSAASLALLDVAYGKFIGQCARQFFSEKRVTPLLVASHGHTVFHRPEKGYTLQIGHGAAIAEQVGVPVVNDFRIADVVKGGQGAPLVPVGDMLLFSGYSACLNIGGIANISYTMDDKRVAYDISPANMVLNHYAKQLGFDMDNRGELAEKGSVLNEMFHSLNTLAYYKKSFPKSMGREWVETNIFSLIEQNRYNTYDVLSTLTEHIAFQISSAIHEVPQGKVLITGGGAYNDFLIASVKKYISNRLLIIPSKEVVDFKEALIFALLGLLRYQGEINVISSVTGAYCDHSAGIIWT